jgi:hypothetical protein
VVTDPAAKNLLSPTWRPTFQFEGRKEMKPALLFIALLATCILWPADASQGACPEEPNDNGVCDTLYVEVHPPDVLFTGSGHLVQVPIRLTHDVSDPTMDSLVYLYIPLCYTHTNPAKYCNLSPYWNNNDLSPMPSERSVFRHFNEETNVIWDLSERCPNLSFCWWDIDLDGTSHVGLPMGPDAFCAFCPYLGNLSRSLLATLTFEVEDTMTICIDTCHLPSTGHLNLWGYGITFVPRDNMPYCFTISAPELGDVNADGVLDVGDVVYLINYCYKFGPAAPTSGVGDANCDGVVNIGDIVRIVGYLFYGQPPLSC